MIVKRRRPTTDQWKAIKSTVRITIVLAGPGTGKTYVAAKRVQYLATVCHVHPSRILAFTFSNIAATEMEASVARFCKGRRFPWLGTTHAICARILEAAGHQFDICDEATQEQIIAGVLKKIDPAGKVDIDEAIAYIQWEKMRRQADTSPPLHFDRKKLPVFAKIYRRYQRRLVKAGLKDFNDLLRDAVNLLRERQDIREKYQRKFTYILADEVQDFAPLQVELLRLLIGAKNRAFLIGDDDQSIYRWLWADPSLMRKLIKQYGSHGLVQLRHNFRSSEQIVYGGGGLISHNKSRLKKHVVATRGPMRRIIIRPCKNTNQLAMAIADRIEVLVNCEGIKPERVAVLGRKRVAWGHVLRTVEGRGIACAKDKGANPFASKAAKQLLANMQAAAYPHDKNAFAAIVNTPRRQIGNKAQQQIVEATKKHGCTFGKAMNILTQDRKDCRAIAKFAAVYGKWRKLAKKPPAVMAASIAKELGLNRDDLAPVFATMSEYQRVKAFLEDFKPYGHRYSAITQPGVRFRTIHGAKGTEYDVVFVVGMEHGVLPDERALDNPVAMEEERRLAYVAITRARDKLFIYYVKDGRRFTNLRHPSPSCFIAEIPDEYKWYPGRDAPAPSDGNGQDDKVTDYLPGDTVTHSTFSYGKIEAVSNTNATVKFNIAGIKTVPLASLQLARIRKV